MKLSKAVEVFIQRKRASGLVYAQPAVTLFLFVRKVGNVPLTVVKERQISLFLDGRGTLCNNSWLQKYRILKHFFQYWKSRGKLKTIKMPKPRPPCPRTFVPYIYTRLELRRLLSSIVIRQKTWNPGAIAPFTLRTLLLFLYGTGILVSEALTLKTNDVDLNRNMMTLHRASMNRSRCIPIGRAIHKLLRAYLNSPVRKQQHNENLFLNIGARAAGYVAVYKAFRRLCRFAGITRQDGGRHQPRIHDLRVTFAVHRLAAWFKQGVDVERKLPALSEYLGELDIGSMERYLALTPERFRKQLFKLSLVPVTP